MIAKSYEIEKNISLFLKHNFFLIHGENVGLKNDIKDKLINKIKKNSNTEILSFYENEIIENEDNFYNTVFSGSLFSSEKIIIINSLPSRLRSTFRKRKNI